MVMIFYHNTSNNDHNNIDNTNDSKNNIRTTILKATFPYSENLRIPCFHRTPDLGFGMLL